MSVDFEEKDGAYSEARCFNKRCCSNGRTRGHSTDNGCKYTSNTGKCKNFKAGKQEEPQIEYKITKPFSILDIYREKPCHDQFLRLLEDTKSRANTLNWISFNEIKNQPTLMRNLDWLEKNGFISQKKEEWVNVYIDEKNDTCIGNFTYTSKKRARGDAPPDDNKRYVGSVLKS